MNHCRLGVAVLALTATLAAQDARTRLTIYDLRDFDSAAPEDAAAFAKNLVRHYVQPPWREGSNDVRSHEGALVMLADDDQQKWVDAFLRSQRSGDLFEIEARVFSAPVGAFAAAGPQTGWALESPTACADSLAKLKAIAVDELLAPKVLLQPLQHAVMSTVNEVSYIKEYDVKIVEPGRQAIVDPVVDVVREGITLGASAARIDPAHVALSVDFRNVSLKRPIPTKTVRLLGDREGQISAPEVIQVHFSSDLTLSDGAGAVIVSPGNEGHDLALIVTLHCAKAPAKDQEEHK